MFSFVLEDITKAAEGPNLRNKIYKVINDMKEEKTKGKLGGFFNNMLEQSNIVNIDELADSIHMQLIQTLYTLKNEEHPRTKNIMSILEEYLIMNATNPFDSNEMENIKNNIIANILTEKMVVEILRDIENSIKNMENTSTKATTALVVSSGNSLSYLILNLINSCWDNLKNNVEIKDSIERIIKKSILNLLEKEHRVIGNIVRDTLDAFSDDKLNKFVEDRAGNDLQWIRINGSIVGGMVGIIVFLFLNFFYDPIAVPFIKNLF